MTIRSRIAAALFIGGKSSSRDRKRRRRKANDPTPPTYLDPDHAAYLEDMSEAVDLGRRIEVERRRRGSSPS